MFYMKVLGLTLVFAVCSIIGFLKAQGLKKRRDRLSVLIKCMATLSHYVKIGNSERGYVIEKSFGNEFSKENNNVKEEDLNSEDRELFCEFFEGFGKGDKKAELEKTEMYISILKDNLKAAQADFENQSKLYLRSGVLIGLVICIFLI